jgi:hypothetical protein
VHVPFAPEDADERDIRNLTRIPDLVWRSPTQRSGVVSIVNVNGGINRALPETSRQACCMKHGHSLVHDRLIKLLGLAVLLR